MIDSPAFRYVVLGFLLVAVATPLMLLKLWRVGPPEMKARPRVSTIDFVQAWSLKRNAREAEGRADYPNALAAWRAAAANNPADLVALRGSLSSILRSPRPAEAATTAMNVAGWLLRMGQTNLADVELVAETLNRCELHDTTAVLLSRLTNVASPKLNRHQAAALFRSGRVDEFVKLLNKDPALDAAVQGSLEAPAPSASLSPADAELRLVALAYLAGWNAKLEKDRTAEEKERMARALEALQAAAQDPATETVAHELEMMVYVQRRDEEGCAATFRKLRDAGRASVRHLAMYVTLLLFEDKKDEAKAIVDEVNPVPRTDSDVFRLVALLAALDRLAEADKLCQQYFNDPPWIEEGALIRADLLIEMGKKPEKFPTTWDELRRMAYRIRNHPSTRESLRGFSLYLEGLAELRQGYRDNAVRAFSQAVAPANPDDKNSTTDLFPDNRLALRVADGLLKLNLAEYAEPLLLRRRELARNDPGFLTMLMLCADKRKRGDYLWDAMTNLYALAPNDPMVVNNYAATLLLFRRKPEEAIVHTLRLMQVPKLSNKPEVVLNHVIALTMNNRLDEADELMLKVRPEDLNDDDMRAQYYLALFELRLLQGRKEEAWPILRMLLAPDTKYRLFPVQTEWLEAKIPLFDAPGTPASKP